MSVRPEQPFTIAADVEVRPVEWLWRPYVPLSKVSAIAGKMGQGKSAFTHWLAAAVTTGQGISTRAPGGVVLCSAEDDDADTIVPRLIAHGADLERVALIGGGELNIEAIERACEHVAARLLVLDPFPSFVPASRNAYKSQDVRLVLAPIVELARERQLAALCVQHVNRSDASDALDRIADSQGLPQVARSVLVWGSDPKDERGDSGSRKVLTRPKANLAPGGESPAAAFELISAEVQGAGSQPQLVYRGVSEARADDVVQTAEARSQAEAARLFLFDLLAAGSVPVKDGEAAAAEAGISTHALRKARERYVRSHRPGRNSGPWHWELLHTPTQQQQLRRQRREPTPGNPCDCVLVADANGSDSTDGDPPFDDIERAEALLARHADLAAGETPQRLAPLTGQTVRLA